MANITFSNLLAEDTVSGFDSSNNIFSFDDPDIDAAHVVFTEVGSDLLIQAGGKSITLVGVAFANLSSSNMTFTASILRVGDDSASAGNDALAQFLSGAAGADALYGLGGADTLDGGAGDDLLEGGAGNDTLFGGSGDNDVASYRNAQSAVNVDLDLGVANDGDGGVDELSGIEGVRGSVYDDTLIGSSSNEGDERFMGDAGDDYIDGGGAGGDEGIDIASYRSSILGVVATLSDGSGVVADGFGGMDTLIRISEIEGSGFNDSLIGGIGSQGFSGLGGDDTIDGGTDFDWAVYFDDPQGVIINLGSSAVVVGAETVAGGTARDGWGGAFNQQGVDTLLNIEGIAGSGDADTLIGSAADNEIEGLDGADYIDGGVGNDTFYGGNGNDTYIVDAAGDQIQEGEAGGNDTARSSVTYTLGATAVETLVLTGSGNTNGSGNSYNNIISGNGGNNSINGGAGADILAGGPGNDTYVVDHIGDQVMELANSGLDTVQSDRDYNLMSAWHVESLTLTGGAGLSGIGNWLNNFITGNTGNNVLDGNRGSDTLAGGAGNDQYVVDNPGDVVLENAAQGVDLVLASVGYVLGDHQENLTLTGSSHINGTGNDLDNVITGNSGNNALDGAMGADQMSGGAGNDQYVVDSLGDVVLEGAGQGVDLVLASVSYVLGDHQDNLTLTGSSHIIGTGNDLDNVITGNLGDNTLTGGAGADQMSGGAGNDQYVVDNPGDVVLEGADEGVDLVLASVSYVLGYYQNNLTLTGSSHIIGTGNDLDNVITGNSGDNTLTGGAGADQMSGGAGNDQYVVDNPGDVITELADEGVDSVRTAVGSYTLGANIENLYLNGTQHISGTGNELSNVISGNLGNNLLFAGLSSDFVYGDLGDDTLRGSDGGDTLWGGSGDDVFVMVPGIPLPWINGGPDVNNAGWDTIKFEATGLHIDLRGSWSEDFIQNIDVIDLNHAGNSVAIDADFILSACDAGDGPLSGFFSIMINGGNGDAVFGGFDGGIHEPWSVEMTDGNPTVVSYRGHSYNHYFSYAAVLKTDVFLEVGVIDNLIVV